MFWWDLHLDEEESITTAPAGIGMGGVVEVDDIEGLSPCQFDIVLRMIINFPPSDLHIIPDHYDI